MSKTYRHRNLIPMVTDGYNWVREAKSPKPVKAKRIEWLKKSVYTRLSMHRDNPRRNKQIRKNRRINKLICRGLCPEKIFPNWKLGYY
jgi:hypothetical protein